MKVIRTDDAAVAKKANKRLDRLSDMEILNWLDLAVGGVGRGLSDYERRFEPDSIGEARIAAVSILEAIKILDERGKRRR